MSLNEDSLNIESILLCGDIHPHPGPNNPERLSIRTNVNSDQPMPARIMYTASQLLSFNNISQHSSHAIGDLVLTYIQQAGILRCSTNHTVTPSRIQVHVTEPYLRRSPRRLNPSPMAYSANNPTDFFVPLRPNTVDKALLPTCHAIAQRDPVLLLFDVGKTGP